MSKFIDRSASAVLLSLVLRSLTLKTLQERLPCARSHTASGDGTFVPGNSSLGHTSRRSASVAENDPEDGNTFMSFDASS